MSTPGRLTSVGKKGTGIAVRDAIIAPQLQWVRTRGQELDRGDDAREHDVTGSRLGLAIRCGTLGVDAGDRRQPGRRRPSTVVGSGRRPAHRRSAGRCRLQAERIALLRREHRLWNRRMAMQRVAGHRASVQDQGRREVERRPDLVATRGLPAARRARLAIHTLIICGGMCRRPSWPMRPSTLSVGQKERPTADSGRSGAPNWAVAVSAGSGAGEAGDDVLQHSRDIVLVIVVREAAAEGDRPDGEHGAALRFFEKHDLSADQPAR